jgi:putative ABC transport system permease protein
MIFARNLLRNKTRTVITLLGIAIGIAIYAAIAAIVGGLRREAADVIAGYETDIAVQARGAANPMASRIAPAELAELEKRFGSDITPFALGTLREEWNAYALVIGTTARMVTRIGIDQGKSFRVAEREVVLGAYLARRLGQGPGSELSLGGERFRVTGTYHVGNRFIDGAVIMDLAEAQRLLGLGQGANVLLLRAGERGDPHRVADSINADFPRLRALASDDFLRTLRIFKTIQAFVNAVAIIAFLGSVIFVTNTLLMGLSERTRELGILLAIGWSPFRILRMLVLESLSLCVIGGILGNALALLLLFVLNDSRIVGFGWVPIGLPISSVVASLGLAAAVGFFACVWPALVIWRLSPVEALRHE